MKFTTQKLVRFHQCDPAGIVFYPQFFYLLHEVQEDFLAHIGFPQHRMIENGFGTPVVDIRTRFLDMCRYGDDITISVSISKLGNSSMGMDYEIHSADNLKLTSSWVLVYSALSGGKPVRIPDDLRNAMQPYLQQSQRNLQETT